MVTRKPATKKSGKLKLKKETIRDLDAKGNAGKVKGGTAVPVRAGSGPQCPTGIMKMPPAQLSKVCRFP